MLAADLGVRWDVASPDYPSAIVPGLRVDAPIEVINNGPAFADGTVTIRFFLSTDQTLDNNDITLRTYSNLPLQLPVFAGIPDNIGTFRGDLTIPSDLAAGTYFLIVRISPSSSIADFNQTNNTAATEDKFPAGRFGNADGLVNATTTLLDADGTRVTFAMTGGGSGTVQLTPAGFVLTLTNSTLNSRVNVSADNSGDRRFTFASVTINGAVLVFNAPAGRLAGPLTSTAGFGAMTFSDVVGPRTITVPNSTLNPSFAFGAVTDLSISSPIPIASITATSWTNTGSARAVISAPWIGSITVAGDLGVNLNLSGRDGNAPTLGPVSVGGFLRPSAWVVRGIGSSISALATTGGFVATFSKRLTSLSTTLSLRGLITARSFQSISSGLDIAGARILAGAFLGDDAALGGSGAAADTFLNGVISSVSVQRNVTNSTIAAGLDPVDSILRNGNDRIVSGRQSQLGPISVAGFVGAGARFIANVYSTITIAGAPIDWRTDQRFSLLTPAPVATLQSWTTTNATTQTFTVLITSSSIMRLIGVSAASLRVTPGDPAVPVPAISLQSVTFAPGSNQSALRAVFTTTADFSAGQFVVSVPGATIFDARGLSVAPIDLLTIGT
jgi:hypothetical protein